MNKNWFTIIIIIFVHNYIFINSITREMNLESSAILSFIFKDLRIFKNNMKLKYRCKSHDFTIFLVYTTIYIFFNIITRQIDFKLSEKEI